MTSASELFYTRRSRLGRTGGQDLGLDSFASSERSFNNRRHHHHNHRHDLDGCDPVRRPSHVRHSSHRPSQSERPSGRLDQGSGPFVSNNTINTVILRSTSGPSLNGNERLPGTVLLARARLLERLSGMSLSENRRSSSASSGVNRRENIFGDEFRLTDVDRGAETSSGWFTGGSPFMDLPPQTERLHLLQEPKSKPPGLTQEAMNCLHSEVFSSFGKIVEREVSEASVDCSICLESFMDGDELVCLPCNHRFHSACLDPWVRSCGDCPYCRRDIVVNNKDIKRT